MKRIGTLFLVWLLMATPVLAQDSSTFSIKVFGAEDVVAPTTPTLSGSAVSETQVDLSWTAATDNYLVSGYVVYRGGLPIATTTLTAYSDAGLTASTTYSYTVRAFDPSFNYSSSSNIVTVTTPDYPPAPVAEEGTAGTATRVVLNNLSIDTEERSALFTIQTVRPARFEIRWGRTSSYELGYTVNDIFTSSHRSKVTGLEPGTIYQYEVVGYTPFGKATVLERGQFSTRSLADSFAPTNVQAFSAVRDGIDVGLTWKLPPEEDVTSIRIVRSHLGFPAHTQDGVVVYQGLGTSFTDEDILSLYSPVYYTAFVVDAAGNVSSGAVARVFAQSDGTPVYDGGDPPIPSGIDGEIKEDTVASTSPQVAPGTRMPGLEEIFLWQNEARQSLAVQTVQLSSEEAFLLSIPKSAVSDNLKTILASLTDPSDSRQTYSFMLRLNKDQTAYEAVLPPTLLEGKSRLIIDIYDYEALIVANYQKTILFKKEKADGDVPVFPDKIITTFAEYGWMIAVPLFLFMVLILLYRRKRPLLEDNL